jgi:hypothetical protein
MKRIVVVLASLFLLAAPAVFAGEGHVNLFLGQKQLEHDFQLDVADQDEFGVQVSFGNPDWPVMVAVDLMTSSADERVGPLVVDVSTTELNTGVRKFWEKGRARPYIGGGLAFINGEVTIDTGLGDLSGDESAVGVWIGGGAFWRLGRSFNIGVDARITRAEAEVGGVDTELGGNHIGLLLGWGWD